MQALNSPRAREGPDVPVQPMTAEGLHAVLTLSPDAILVVDRHGTIHHANALAATLFRATIDGLSGASVDTLVPAHLRATHAAERARFDADPGLRTMGSGRDLYARRRDGSTFPVDISLHPVIIDDRRLVLAAIRDVGWHHELRAENQQLADHARILREFVSLASHELRTPLTAVRGFAEPLLEGRVTPEAHDELLGRIVRNAARQEELIAGLLTLSRIQAGRLTVRPDVLDLQTLVTGVVEAIDDDAVTTEVPRLHIWADALWTEQVIVNLVTNALRYGAPPVLIDAHRRGLRVVLTVQDRGPGIDPDFEPVLFEAFQQQSTGDSRVAQGLGIGLFLARDLMTAMDGSIHYRRDDTAAWTTFELRFRTTPPD